MLLLTLLGAALTLGCSFEMALGNYELGEFSALNNDPALTTSALIAFTLYMIFVVLIMLNLLIAIMGSSYGQILAALAMVRALRLGCQVIFVF